MAFIQLDKISRHYDAGVKALDAISLEIQAGEWIAIMGPSGSGKTTLMNILGGLDQPDGGRVVVDGVDLSRASRQDLVHYRRERVGLVFQQFHLIPYLSALENVMLAQYIHSIADESEAAGALAEVGLGHRLRHLPSQLSGGEKQRVCIARALINQPKLILADEPTGNLDEENERLVLEIFQRMHDRGKTLVMVSHDLAVGRRADRQIQLEHGRLSGYYLTPFQEDEDIDEVLEYLWLVKEGHPIPPEVCQRGAMLAGTELMDQMRRKNLIIRTVTREGAIAQSAAQSGLPGEFTEEGAWRAQRLIRRHRLAEKLFAETFLMEAKSVEEEACYFEHVLSPGMTDAICTFLGHPAECPHGHPIPAGECCPPGTARLSSPPR